MSASTLLLHKEFRALAPLWSASAAAVLASGIVRHFDAPTPTIVFTLTTLAILAFAVGTIALGAHSVGHEYTYQTLPVLLSQPLSRPAMLGAKFAALAPLVLTLFALTWWLFFRGADGLKSPWVGFPPILVAACALSLAPWLTMICRSTMAGIVFTCSIPPCLLIAGDLIGVWQYGASAGAPIDRFKFGLLWWGTLSACAGGALAGWRTFMRLETIQGDRHLQLPELRAGAPRSRRSHPVLLLLTKELRLQQLTFVLVAIYATALVTLRLTRGVASVADVFFPVTVLYAVLLSAVIGSLALAEERQYGMQDVQRLLPIALWKQWMIKVGVAFALALLLGFLIPMFGTLLGGGAPLFPRRGRTGLWQIIPILLLTSGSLYASSLSSSGVRAMLTTLSGFAATAVFGGAMNSVLHTRAASRVFQSAASLVPFDLTDRALKVTFLWTPPALAAAMTLLLLWFAFKNDQAGARSPFRVGMQLVCIAAVIGIALTLLAAAGVAWEARMRR